jgi:peptidoglycan-associated lipoprotein
MFKNLSLVLAALIMAFAMGCAKKKATDDQAGMGAGAGDQSAQVSSEPLSFNAAGSDSGAINGLRTLNFGYDSSSIDATGREVLTGNAAWMKENAAVTIQIEGHCDNRGSVEYNLALGERRAKAVKDYLVGLGIDAKRLTVISFGKEKPLEIGDSESVYAKNRRANFVPLK